MFVTGTNDVQRDLNRLLIKSLEGYPCVSYDMESWWDKPFVLLHATRKYGKVVWVDNDVEIVSKEFFSILDIPATSASWDAPASNFNTGVIVINEEHAYNWAINLDYTKHGDQDSFPKPDYYLDSRFNSLRLAPVPNAYAHHHTGAAKWKYLNDNQSSLL